MHQGLATPTASGRSVINCVCPLETADRSIDSDSELEEGGEPLASGEDAPRHPLVTQGSETSADEAHSCDDLSEGQRSRTCSTGQWDAECAASRQRGSPGEEQSDLEEDSGPEREGGARPLSDYNTNQSNNKPPARCSLGHGGLPTIRLRDGKLVVRSASERQPRFV